jgi:hypothetical protein
MFRRRSLMAGVLTMAAAPSLSRLVHAQARKQSGKPVLVFMGHAL